MVRLAATPRSPSAEASHARNCRDVCTLAYGEDMTNPVERIEEEVDASLTREIPWSVGSWSHFPAGVAERGGELLVTAVEGSDAWLHTEYGFVHDSEHALLAPFAVGEAVEVSFRAELHEQFDQAGVFVSIDDDSWVKAGVEFADGTVQLGAVVTDRKSDWSVSPVPDWASRVVTVRVSRSPDALTIRARVDDEPWRLVRLAPFDGDAAAQAGPYLCAPTRAGLTVPFLSWKVGPADTALH